MEETMNEKSFKAWSWPVEQCLKEYKVKLDNGLSGSEVEKQREKFGWNELQKEKGKPLWRLVLEQFDDMLVKILLLAALISLVLAYLHGNETGESGFEAYVEPFVIVLILILNAIMGVWQESNAEKALEALKEMQCDSGKVLRDGYLVPDLPARELVPGDIVELRVGDKVPADMRVAVLKTSTLRVEQSSLTGESMPVMKGTNAIFMDDCELQAKENMVFAGTTVVNGSCVCIVVNTGMRTEIGKIQTQIHEASLEESDTPLKKKLDEFGNRLTTAIGLVCLAVWIINYKYFLTWELVNGWPTNFQFSFKRCTYYFKIAVALAVAAIPEGLPAVITTCLALGTRKMAQKNAIVRKLPSVETLGCTTVICSDKTGTLTTNQMSVTEFFTMGGKTSASRIFHVQGTTYDPKDGGIIDWNCYNMDANLQAVAEICAICNDAGISCDGRVFKAMGLPTEAALKVLVEKMGVPDSKVRNRIRDSQPVSNYLIGRNTVKLGCCEWWTERSKKVATLEFDRVRKSMSVIVSEPNGHNRLLVKGAVENLLERSSHIQLADGSIVPLDEPCRQLLLLRHLDMSSKGLRCLGLAYKDELGDLSDYYTADHPAHKKLLDHSSYSSIESDLVFVGVVGLRDPPREEVHEAMEDCRGAGIEVMVITGDNKSTAEAICREIGLFSEGQNLQGRSFTCKEFMALSSSQQIEILSKPGGKVFSRAEPRHKQYIVRMLKEMGEIVAMTGDGVNDAPALKLADIGIAMGITGTEVAKEASDMVLADDNFSTIVSAVAEGRSIYNNMKAFIRYMISSNIGEVICIFLTATLGIPECMIPVQHHSKELLDWALVKVAHPGDCVVAVHVCQNSDSLSKVKALLEDYLEDYQWLCNQKQATLSAEVFKGNSIGKVLVREAKNYAASIVIVGITKDGAIWGRTSIAKYCAKQLPSTTEVMAIHDGKVVFTRSSNSQLEGSGRDPRPSLYLMGNVTFKDIQSELVESEPSEVGRLGDENCCQSLRDEAFNPVKRRIRGSWSSISLKVEDFSQEKPGWPLLQTSSSITQPAPEARQMSVVQWVMSLPNRSLIEASVFKSNLNETDDTLGIGNGISAVNSGDYKMSVRREEANHLELIPVTKSSGCKWFSHELLQMSTSQFSSENLIGKGGCNSVYKGLLPNGKQVAVKTLISSKEARKNFTMEVDIMTTLKHKGITTLLGICVEDENLISVYDFLPTGNLEENLQRNIKQNSMPWEVRFKIAVGIAEALKYLHDECPRPVIHRDIKSSNILLTDTLEPQLSDFGLAIWGPETESFLTVSDVVGTFGYLAPEYFMYGKVSDKIDVYAFGVVLLELLSGRKPVGFETLKGQESLVMWARPKLDNGDLKSILDPNLSDNVNEAQVRGMARAATLCLKQAARLRPRMCQILNILMGEEFVNEDVKSQFGNGYKSEIADDNDDEVYPDSSVESHLSLAFLDINGSSTSFSSQEQRSPLTDEEYFKIRWSRSSDLE